MLPLTLLAAQKLSGLLTTGDSLSQTISSLATEAGVTSWTDHVKSLGVGLLSNEIDSWMTGINRNVEGKTTRIINRYSGSAPAYRARCDAVAANVYQELALS